MSHTVNPRELDRSSEVYPPILHAPLAPITEPVRTVLEQRQAAYKAEVERLGITDESELVRTGTYALVDIFRSHILDVVLALSGDPHRDVSEKPITVSEVAQAVTDSTGIDVRRASTIPFIYNEAKGKYVSDGVNLLWNGNHQSARFSTAFDDLSDLIDEILKNPPVVEPPAKKSISWD